MPSEQPLKLECGNPSTQPASFSRFVLPFAYTRKEIPRQDGLRYVESRPDPKSLIHRKKYFTPEIQRVLFDKAKWLEVYEKQNIEESSDNVDPIVSWCQTPWGKSEESLTVQGKKIRVGLLPPRLVLFEWSDGHDESLDILQTGFLLVDLWFPKPAHNEPGPNLDHLLLINDLFRYFDCPYEKHRCDMHKLLDDVPLEYSTEDPMRIRKDSDLYSERWTNLLTIPVNLGERWYRLVPDQLPEAAMKMFTGESFDTDAANYLIYSDNRAYVWSAAILGRGGQALQAPLRTNAVQAHEFGHWIKFLNVDPPEKTFSATHKAVSDFDKKWAKNRTYHRWETWGTWYGFSYHSGVMLAPPFNEPYNIPLWKHFREMYFDQTILLFYLRVTLFRFSGELSNITRKKLDNASDDSRKSWFDSFNLLRERFTEFTILYQFPLLSNQQQSIEMYELARRHFDVDDFYAEVKREIDDTHQYIELVESRKISEVSNSLAEAGNEVARQANIAAGVGIPLVAIGVMVSLFGMTELIPSKCLHWPVPDECEWSRWFIWQTVISVVVGLIAWPVVRRWLRKEHNQR